MGNIKFKLKENWNIKSEFVENGLKTIFEKGHIFEPNKEGEYVIDSPIGSRTLSLEDMRKSDKFEEVKQHKMEVTNIDEITEIDEVENNWRIELNVKTTKSKLKEIQRLIEKHVYPIL